MLFELLERNQIQRQCRDFILDNLKLLSLHHDDSCRHSIRTAYYGEAISQYCENEFISSNILVPACFLHDIGKRFVEKKLLDKKGIFSSEEHEKTKPHVEKGYRI